MHVLLKSHVVVEEDITILLERIENKSFYLFNQFLKHSASFKSFFATDG
jgi:hypothetical protein